MGGAASVGRNAMTIEDQIRLNLSDHGNEGLVLHTILFDPLARSTFFDFLEDDHDSHFITLYLEILNCKLIDETHFKGEQDNSDFFEKLYLILNEHHHILHELSEAQTEIDFLLHRASHVTRDQATDALVRIERSIVNHVKPWFPFFERSKVFAEYRNYYPAMLFPTKLEPISKVRRRGNSFTKYLENTFNMNNAKAFYTDHEVLILERGSITSKILIRSLQPYFKGVTHVYTPHEAEEVLAQKQFHLLLISVEPDFLDAVEVVASYLRVKQSLEPGNLKSVCVGGEKFKFDGLTEAKQPTVRPPVVLGMSACGKPEFKKEICSKGFKAVLSRPFTISELMIAKGDLSITTVVANIATTLNNS